MPIIYTTHLVDANGDSVLAVMSRHEPDEATFVAPMLGQAFQF